MSFLFLIATGFAIHAGESLEKIADRYSLEQLQQTANYLSLRVENSGAPLLKCDVNSATAQKWLASLHPLLDLKAEDDLKTFKKTPARYLSRAKNCHSRCTCSVYATLVTAAEPDMPNNPELKKISAVLAVEAKKENPASCAKRLAWFCESPLKKFLAEQ